MCLSALDLDVVDSAQKRLAVIVFVEVKLDPGPSAEPDQADLGLGRADGKCACDTFSEVEYAQPVVETSSHRIQNTR